MALGTISRKAAHSTIRAPALEATVKHVSTPSKTAQAAKGHPVVQWTFQRGTRTLTCQVAKAPRRSYAVCLVPHWDVRASAVESYGEVTSALQRHAKIAEALRSNGWTVRAYTAA
jgi:hypothetical protein